jgi:hypothetical protein
LLHSLAPLKLKMSSSLFCTLAAGLFVVISSPAVFCLSAVSQYVFLSHSLLCTHPVRVLYWSSFSTELPFLADKFLLVLQSSSNPLKVALRIPSRGHLVEQFIFLCCHTSDSLVAVGTKVYLAIDWQWTSILNTWGRVY